MKKQNRIQAFSSIVLVSTVFLSIILFSGGCKKENSGSNSGLPKISNTEVIKVNKDSVTISAEITSDGGNPIIEKGFVYNTSNNPTTSDSVFKSSATSVGIFSEVLTGFTTNTTYYAKAYATNSSGTAYGEEVNFLIEAVQVGSRFGEVLFFMLTQPVSTD